MQGGLNIEMALWNTVGDYLEDSGWTTALTNADVASAGKAGSFLKRHILLEHVTAIK